MTSTLSDITSSTFETGKGITEDVTGSTSDILKKTGKTASSMFSDVTHGTSELAKGVFGETGKMAKGVVKGTYGLAKDTLKRGTKVADELVHGRVRGAVKATTDLVKDTVGEVVQKAEDTVDYSVTNKYISVAIKILIALYAAFAAPQLPREVAFFFDHTVVRILVAVLIIYVATKDPSMAILIALAFVLTLQTANKYRLLETSKGVTHENQLPWLSSDGPRPGVHEGYADYAGAEGLQYAVVDHENAPVNDYVAARDEPNPTHAPMSGSTHEPTHEPTNRPTYRPKSHPHPDNSNHVPGANQSSCSQTWTNQHCAQGLNHPGGYDPTSSRFSSP